jgi:hypothetical protein
MHAVNMRSYDMELDAVSTAAIYRLRFSAKIRTAIATEGHFPLLLMAAIFCIVPNYWLHSAMNAEIWEMHIRTSHPTHVTYRSPEVTFNNGLE